MWNNKYRFVDKLIAEMFGPAFHSPEHDKVSSSIKITIVLIVMGIAYLLYIK